MILESLITCPHCATARADSMPTNGTGSSTNAPTTARAWPDQGDVAPYSHGARVRRRGATFGRCFGGLLQRAVTRMASDTVQASSDWLSGWRTNLVAWSIPQAPSLPAWSSPCGSTAIWIVALIWMGTACLLNARRCGRTHCRYTGPYYLAMAVPVVVLATGVIALDFYGWLALAILILAGSKIIWWATERAWGKFS